MNGPQRLHIRHSLSPCDESAAPTGFRPSPVGALPPNAPHVGTPDDRACLHTSHLVGHPLTDVIRTAPVIPDQLEHVSTPVGVLAGRVDLTQHTDRGRSCSSRS